jgi:hypothetical protein
MQLLGLAGTTMGALMQITLPAEVTGGSYPTCSARSSGGMSASASKLTAKGFWGGTVTFMLTNSSRMFQTLSPGGREADGQVVSN